MTLSSILSFLIYALVTSITPGPNNIMLASSGITFGFRRSIPHILGIGFGFSLMVFLVGIGIGSILIQHQLVYEFLKLVGIVYLLYLTYQIFKSDAVDKAERANKPLSFQQAAIFQWVNPKAWVMTLGAVTTYTSSSNTFLVFMCIAILYGLVSIPSVGIWAYVGEKAQYLLNNRKKVHYFNMIMACLLFVSTLNPILESVQYFYHLI